MSQNMSSGQVLKTASISRKIVACEVVKQEVVKQEALQEEAPKEEVLKSNVSTSETAAAIPAAESATELAMERVHENLDRPERLLGSTYKIKTPVSPHALYITINDVLLNQGTAFEQRHPYEIFINSKNMDHFMWVVALTRVISAVFRKGGDVTFMVEELKAVFDPKGGYFKKGGRYMPSLVAEIGYAIEDHLQAIGLLESDQLDEGQRQLLAAKRAEYEQRYADDSKVDNDALDKGALDKGALDKGALDNANAETGDEMSREEAGNFPVSAQLCTTCNVKAAILMDGCYTCLNCAESKCG